MGDVHGHRDVLVELLREAGLVDVATRWAGEDARVWLVGDLVDRGPDGIGAIELVRRLERESRGALRCLLGNHEVQLVAVYRFGGEETSIPGQTFRELWLFNGGVESDLRALTPEHVEWMTGLPPLARDGRWSDLHAWVNRLAAEEQYLPFVQAVRLALDRLDFEQIRLIARAAPVRAP